MAALLRKLRQERGISQLQLAQEARVNPSVVHRAERGKDARLSTWDKLFEGLGYRLLIDVTETSEEAADLLTEEADRRREKIWRGLDAGARRR
jgi:transcriptional regulator with XRE-family HTH domain